MLMDLEVQLGTCNAESLSRTASTSSSSTSTVLRTKFVSFVVLLLDLIRVYLSLPYTCVSLFQIHHIFTDGPDDQS